MKSEICLQILTPKSLTNHDEGASLLKLLIEILPEISPEKYGNNEPLKNKFAPENIPQIVAECWPRSNFLWARKKPYASGSVRIQAGKTYIHSGLKFDCGLGIISQEKLIEFLQRSSMMLEADLAVLHLLNPIDMERGEVIGTIVPAANDECYFGITTHDLKKCLPDLYWGTVFGAPYIKLFGLEKLLSSPAYLVKQIGPELVYIQLSEFMEDLRTNFNAVDKVRSNVKKHLGASAFYRSGLLSGFRKAATFNILPAIRPEK